MIRLLFLHWVADFVLQSDWMAQGKSKFWKPLLVHTSIYSICFLPFYGWQFTVITFVCHTITDYITSRINSKLWTEKKVHWFFVSIGFDQWLHYVQLILTLEYLK